jgi:hypothetical protein
MRDRVELFDVETAIDVMQLRHACVDAFYQGFHQGFSG